MELVNTSVHHSRFGSGVVTFFNGSTLKVAFQEGGEHTFSWPGAFEHFLTTDDAAVQAEALSALEKKRAEESAARKSVEEKIAALAPAPARRKPAARTTAVRKTKAK